MTAVPSLSVVIPAFNAASTIDTQLAALAAQDYRAPSEVIVADNGSSDDTRARARAWSTRIPGLRVIDASARQGPSAARNIGAAAARSPLLLFCDADDAAEPGWMEAFATVLARADAAAGGRRYSTLNTTPHGPMDWPEPMFTKSPLVHLAAASSHNLAIRADVFAALGGFDESLAAGEDVDLCWRIQLSGHTFVPAPLAIMQIRRRTGLVATYRQAVAYGRADALLERKYARVAGAHADDRAAPAAPAPRQGVLARVRRRGARLPNPVYLCDRLGKRRGRRLARRLPPPTPYGAEDT